MLYTRLFLQNFYAFKSIRSSVFTCQRHRLRVHDGFLCIDLGRCQVTVAGGVARLTRREFDVLKMLLAHRDRVVTQTQLLREIWGPSHARDTHYLRIIIGRLRQKLRDDPTEPRYLLTEPGVGYRFSTENQS